MERLTNLPCFMHLLLFFASISLQSCSARDTISEAEPLQNPNFIVSSNGSFKLGFFSPENTTNQYVVIMYNNVSELSAVWVANREKPLNDSSGVLTISEDGNLVVLNGKKEIVWSSSALNPAPNSTAQLLEDGNLVLGDSSNGRHVWESFQSPTDTFLAGMKLGATENGTIQLTSWKSFSDPSTGNFTLGISLVRDSPEMFVWKRGVIYWRSGPWNGIAFIGLTETRSVYGIRSDMVIGDSGAAYFTFGDFNNTMLHLKLNYAGVPQQLVTDEKGGWDVAYPEARTECDVYGNCGTNAMCYPSGLPICTCLQGFDPRDREEWSKGNWSGGCLRRTLLQCQRNDSTGEHGEGDGYLKLTNVKVPDFYNLIRTSEVDCGNKCLQNCSCSAYTFVAGMGCLHWADGLIDIQQFSMLGSDLYIRAAHSKLESARSKPKKKAIIASSVSVGCLCLAVSLYILWTLRIKKRGAERRTENVVSNISDKSKLEELPLYSYETIANATDDFHAMNKLGQGGFGPVYKGKLVGGQEIAVKRLSNSSSQGVKEFMNEVILISKLQHRNLVRLLGCCVEREEKMLVYEYLPNKSLDAYIFDSGKQDLLDWNIRSLIIEGIGRGLLYLHRDSRLRIIHRDLKASNILLDIRLNPKISDFGLARIFGGEQDQDNTNRVVGTYGYMAPEYAMGGLFSEKSDVYSFGVLLLEIVSGRRNTNFFLDEENLSLLGYAWKLWNENEAVNLAFTEQHDPNLEMEIQRCVQAGLMCVQDNPNDRPNMSNVLSMLNSEMADLPLPKLPVYTSAFSLSEGHCIPQSTPSNNGVSLTEIQGR